MNIHKKNITHQKPLLISLLDIIFFCIIRTFFRDFFFTYHDILLSNTIKEKQVLQWKIPIKYVGDMINYLTECPYVKKFWSFVHHLPLTLHNFLDFVTNVVKWIFFFEFHTSLRECLKSLIYLNILSPHHLNLFKPRLFNPKFFLFLCLVVPMIFNNNITKHTKYTNKKNERKLNIFQFCDD